MPRNTASSIRGSGKHIVVMVDKYDSKVSVEDLLHGNDKAFNLIDYIFTEDGRGKFDQAIGKDSISCYVSDSTFPEYQRCLEEIVRARGHIDGISVSTGSDHLVYFAAMLRSGLGIQSDMGEQEMLRFYDKLIMKKAVIEGGIRTPPMVAATWEAAQKLISETGFPIVLKPRRSSGSLGVMFLMAPEDLGLLRNIDPSEHLLEQFLDGQIYRSDGFVSDGILKFNITFKYNPSPYDYYINKQQQIVTMVGEESSREEIDRFASTVLSTLKLRNGVFHLEFIRTEDGQLHFLEVACRSGGGAIRKLLQRFEIDLNAQMVRITAGLPPLVFSYPKKHLWTYEIPAPCSKGTIMLDSYDLKPVQEMRSFVGTTIPAPGTRLDSDAIIDFYFASASEEDCAKESDQVKRMLKVKFNPTSVAPGEQPPEPGLGEDGRGVQVPPSSSAEGLPSGGITLIPRKTFPALKAVLVQGQEHALGLHQDFRRHPAVDRFIPESARLAMAWVHLDPGERLAVHEHPIETMIVLCCGRGRLVGDLQAELREGDVVLIGRGAKHGFEGGRPDGYWALSIQFEGRGLYENAEQPLVAFQEERPNGDGFAELVRRNQDFMEAHKTNQIFQVIQSERIADPACRGRLLDAIQIWSSHFQRVAMSRYVFSGDPAFLALAAAHLKEEYGHDEHLRNSRKSEAKPLWDPVLEASSSWFAAQMLRLSDPGKAVLVHLVLEGAARVFHLEAVKIMNLYQETDHFEIHNAEDDTHLEMGLDLLRGLEPRTYHSLFRVQKEGWDMFNLLSQRIAQICEALPPA